jgi:hypothetical protein
MTEGRQFTSFEGKDVNNIKSNEIFLFYIPEIGKLGSFFWNVITSNNTREQCMERSFPLHSISGKQK